MNIKFDKIFDKQKTKQNNKKKYFFCDNILNLFHFPIFNSTYFTYYKYKRKYGN